MMSVIIEGMEKGNVAITSNVAHSHTLKARSSKEQHKCLFLSTTAIQLFGAIDMMINHNKEGTV